MQQNIVVEVDSRSSRGTNASRRLRRAGLVPGIVYGLDRPSFSVTVHARRIEEILKLESGRNTIFTLALSGEGGKKRSVMIRDLQRDPVTENVVHVDFVRVDLTKRVVVMVPIRLIGIAEGVKNEGGTLEVIARSVEVECLPGNIPEHFDVDVTALHVGQHVSISDLPAAEGVEILSDADTVVATIAAPRVEAAPVAEGAEGEAEAKEAEEGEKPAESGSTGGDA